MSYDTWSSSSWRTHPIKHQPAWPDQARLDGVLKELAGYPPLVFAGESRRLQNQLGRVANGEAFLLQAGDCAESFAEFSADQIRDKLKILLQMAVVLTYSSGVPTVKVGRIAGQFAKPRSSPTETQDGVELNSFLGHMVNDANFSEDSRAHNAGRLQQAYHQSSSTLNLLRAFTKGGFADLNQVHAWNQEFVASSPAGQRYEDLADEIERALRFMRACGLHGGNVSEIHEVDFFTSHEALILDYEEALTREDSLTGDWYDCSAHMLWIGERTRQLDGAHVEFLRGVKNPLGCKVGPTATTDEVLGLCEALNPNRIPGRLTLISRMGADTIEADLAPLLAAARDADYPVVWACDPMHGNTFTSDGGRKTRHFDAVMAEIQGFFAAHRSEGTWPGGVHVELTGDDVTECLGGGDELATVDLEVRYETMCDPRLNGRQSLDLAFGVAELMRA
ncbi:MAG: 3-deoxy-7-phosphoheptulonate synthase class II [Actinomycetia bacterium]|nr:3-deoxy-7-phosphoheptulonate synthase class II [Actinomycetes bacterium]